MIGGDKIIVSGTLGDHAMAILCARNDFKMVTKIKSDCASLNGMIKKILKLEQHIHFMRDATRGGMATVLCEIAESRNLGIEFLEDAVPVSSEVKSLCDILGFDPLYLANEGKIVLVCQKNKAGAMLEILRKTQAGKNAAIVGEIVSDHPGRVRMQTSIGGQRYVEMLTGEQLPRIC